MLSVQIIISVKQLLMRYLMLLFFHIVFEIQCIFYNIIFACVTYRCYIFNECEMLSYRDMKLCLMGNCFTLLLHLNTLKLNKNENLVLQLH